MCIKTWLVLYFYNECNNCGFTDIENQKIPTLEYPSNLEPE